MTFLLPSGIKGLMISLVKARQPVGSQKYLVNRKLYFLSIEKLKNLQMLSTSRSKPSRSVLLQHIHISYAYEIDINFIEIILQHGCSPVNLLHIFRAPCEDLCATYENGGKWNMETCLNMFQKKWDLKQLKADIPGSE